MYWYVTALRKYAIFNGRSQRAEYWMFTLFNFLFSLALGFLEIVLQVVGLSLIYALAILVPSITVTVRRLHDTNRSGWWILIALIPFLGWIVLLVFMVLDGDKQRNRFGPDPKRVGA